MAGNSAVGGGGVHESVDTAPPCDRGAFKPSDRTTATPSVQPADEAWVTVLESECTFPPDVFNVVMLNLIKNPNVTSSHLFRADIFYDSGITSDNDLENHLKPDYRPRGAVLPGYELARTIVRQLIPRNVQLDRPLVQTCHFFQKLDDDDDDDDDDAETNVILYIPHVDSPEQMPFYHPSVAKLAFSHTWPSGTVSISYGLFPDDNLTMKLERTALRLLQTVHKHGQGQLAGYEKRVHLDQVIPQKRYQDTYARLKAKHGRQLAEQWVEVTDPGKHVFEDIAIAAFLVELWRDTYRSEDDDDDDRPPFPGFVDIGCGNGILVHLLIEEGYRGWGFDARQRKTWSIFPATTQASLHQKLLVPDLLQRDNSRNQSTPTHYDDGIFAPASPFIISNHADELTAWTPLLAHLNDSSFIAIPCCSHDLSGSRFRAPPTIKANKDPATAVSARLPQQASKPHDNFTNDSNQAAETGTLKRTEAQKKMPSAYATLCSYVTSLAEEVGFEVEKEVLRIPSTRSQSIIGRRRRARKDSQLEDENQRRNHVVALVERELGRSIDVIGGEWIERAEKLAKKPGSGH